MVEKCEGCPLKLCEHFMHEDELRIEDLDQLSEEFSKWQWEIDLHQEEIDLLQKDLSNHCVAAPENIDRLSMILFEA